MRKVVKRHKYFYFTLIMAILLATLLNYFAFVHTKSFRIDYILYSICVEIYFVELVFVMFFLVAIKKMKDKDEQLKIISKNKYISRHYFILILTFSIVGAVIIVLESIFAFSYFLLISLIMLLMSLGYHNVFHQVYIGKRYLLVNGYQLHLWNIVGYECLQNDEAVLIKIKDKEDITVKTRYYKEFLKFLAIVIAINNQKSE